MAIALVLIAAQFVSIEQGLARTCFTRSAFLDEETADPQTGSALPTAVASPATAALSKNPSTLVVAYHDGELTIEAHHSALSEILRAVSNQTGAAIDFPPEMDRPVAGHIGPGQAVGVLARMLNFLDFDYAILASVAHPQVPVRVILFPKTSISAPPQQAQAMPSLPPQPSADLARDVAVVEEASGDTEVQQQQIFQQWSTVQQNLMERLNARGKQ